MVSLSISLAMLVLLSQWSISIPPEAYPCPNWASECEIEGLTTVWPRAFVLVVGEPEPEEEASEMLPVGEGVRGAPPVLLALRLEEEALASMEGRARRGGVSGVKAAVRGAVEGVPFAMWIGWEPLKGLVNMGVETSMVREGLREETMLGGWSCFGAVGVVGKGPEE
jgi:hypothetical protein